MDGRAPYLISINHRLKRNERFRFLESVCDTTHAFLKSEGIDGRFSPSGSDEAHADGLVTMRRPRGQGVIATGEPGSRVPPNEFVIYWKSSQSAPDGIGTSTGSHRATTEETIAHFLAEFVRERWQQKTSEAPVQAEWMVRAENLARLVGVLLYDQDLLTRKLRQSNWAREEAERRVNQLEHANHLLQLELDNLKTKDPRKVKPGRVIPIAALIASFLSGIPQTLVEHALFDTAKEAELEAQQLPVHCGDVYLDLTDQHDVRGEPDVIVEDGAAH